MSLTCLYAFFASSSQTWHLIYLMSLLTGFAGGFDGLNCARAHNAKHTTRAVRTAVLRMTKTFSGLQSPRTLQEYECAQLCTCAAMYVATAVAGPVEHVVAWEPLAPRPNTNMPACNTLQASRELHKMRAMSFSTTVPWRSVAAHVHVHSRSRCSAIRAGTKRCLVNCSASEPLTEKRCEPCEPTTGSLDYMGLCMALSKDEAEALLSQARSLFVKWNAIRLVRQEPLLDRGKWKAGSYGKTTNKGCT